MKRADGEMLGTFACGGMPGVKMRCILTKEHVLYRTTETVNFGNGTLKQGSAIPAVTAKAMRRAEQACVFAPAPAC